MLKNIQIILFIAICSTYTYAQDDEKWSAYFSAGVSISNTGSGGTFATTSYPSIEFGLMKNNFAAGLVLGRGSFSDFQVDYLSNYFYEFKSALYFGSGNLQPYGLLGIGGYFDTYRYFIEYGAGMYYSFDKIGIFAQASNWDGIWYVTPGLSFSF